MSLNTNKMRKILFLYWYAPREFWHPVYNLHIKNLLQYSKIFDEVQVFVAVDDDIELARKTIESLSYVLPPFRFTVVKNDPKNREASVFYHEIVEKLGEFDENTAIFFAHNKGVATVYTTMDDRNAWIETMYFCNLSNVEKIDEMINDENTCAIGTGRMVNYNPPEFIDLCTNRWIYAGTFFWVVPKRIDNYIKKHNISINGSINRYYAEGFLGSIFPDDAEECKCIGGGKKQNEWWGDYFYRIRNSI